METKPEVKVSICPEIAALESIYDGLNDFLYDGKLPRPVISITPRPTARKRRVLGWCTSKPAWTEANTETGFTETDTAPKHYEISICAEFLSAPIAEIAETMAHEMVHHYCGLNEIKDTTRGGTYHNKKFRDVAEAHGLDVEYDSAIGWSLTKPTAVLAGGIEKITAGIKMDVARIVSRSSSTYKKPFKYCCPVCGTKFDSRKPVNATCMHEVIEERMPGRVPPPEKFECLYDPRDYE